MKDPEKLEQLLKLALSPTCEPKEELNQKIISQLEKGTMKTVYKKKISSIVIIAAVLTLAMSITVFAALRLLNSKNVAEHLEDTGLAEAFEGKDAIEVNKSIESGGYIFTFHGIVSGEGLSKFRHSAEDINPDRTYAVISIAKADGSSMPDTTDEEYEETPFFISPLIKGQKPWQVNIASMNGAYGEFVEDGIMYRLIQCDGVEMFADRGLYLAASTGSFYDINAFSYDEKTGEVTPNPQYEGANALFDLPINPSKADREKAELYLKNLFREDAEGSESDTTWEINIDKELQKGVVIPESIKEVTYDENGLACYEYEDGDTGGKISVAVAVDELFEENQTGVSSMAAVSEEDGKITAVQFSRDDKGVITGRVLVLESISNTKQTKPQSSPKIEITQ